MRVQLFVPCFIDQLYPQTAFSMVKVLEKADMYAGGTEIEYCRIACLYMMGKRSEALYKLSEALQCDYETHKTLFNWQPELAEKADLQAVITAFLP